MTFDHHVSQVRDQLLVIGSAGSEAVQEASSRLAVALEPALRLALQNALAEAAGSLSDQLVGLATVEVRLEGGEPVLVGVPEVPSTTVLAVAQHAGDAVAPDLPGVERDHEPAGEFLDEAGQGDGVTRFTLRLPQRLKSRIDAAAASAGLSVNTWVVQATERAVDGERATPRTSNRAGSSLSGWLG